MASPMLSESSTDNSQQISDESDDKDDESPERKRKNVKKFCCMHLKVVKGETIEDFSYTRWATYTRILAKWLPLVGCGVYNIIASNKPQTTTNSSKLRSRNKTRASFFI